MDYVCDECNGSGSRDSSKDPVISLFGKILPPDIKCKKCKGTGNVNWVENIFGKTSLEDKVRDWIRSLGNEYKQKL
jgi:DnaJ-class molecular chaperone